jgi:hypothetical protein
MEARCAVFHALVFSIATLTIDGRRPITKKTTRRVASPAVAVRLSEFDHR